MPPNLYAHDLQRRLESSAECLRRAVDWDGGNAQAYYVLAKIYYVQSDFDTAIEALSKIDGLRPNNPLVHIALGDVYDAMGIAEKAVFEYERSGVDLARTRLGERAVVNYLKLADAHLEAGDPNSAIPFLGKVYVTDPRQPYALYHLAKILESIENGGRLLAAEKYEKLRSFDITSLDMQENKRLDNFTAKVLPLLVKDGIWSLDDAMSVISFWKSQGEVDLVETALMRLFEQYPEGRERLESY